MNQSTHTTHDTRHTTHDTRHTTHDTRHTTHDMTHTTREEEMEGTYLDANIGDEDVLVDDVAAVLLGRVPGQVLLPHPVGHVAVGALEDLLPDDLLGLLEQALVGRLSCVRACVRAKPIVSTTLQALSKCQARTQHSSRALCVPSQPGKAGRREQPSR